ncbi:MAG: signal peptidase I [Lagierella massiliensis]|nr:signal peptidase I [Lagierella massiliensis]
MKRKTFISYIFLIFNIIFIFFIGLNLYFPEKVMDVFKFRPFIIVSDSMSPVIEIGDIVIITKTNTKELEVGDIISFRWDDKNIIHYVADIRENEKKERVFKTRNEQAKNPSEWDYWSIDEDSINGKSSFKIPKLGYLGLFLRSRQGMFSILILIIVFLLRQLVIKYYEED